MHRFVAGIAFGELFDVDHGVAGPRGGL